jgi:hypothetical protein
MIQIAVLGGTGKEGGGLAYRWAHAGYSMIIGSRDAEKARRAADEINKALGIDSVRGLSNEKAASEADIIILSVPYSAHQSTLESVREWVAGKTLVDVTVPIVPPHLTTVTLPAGRTAAQEAQILLGESVRVVSAFQNVSALHLKDLEHVASCDVLITGDSEEAKQEVIALAESAGMRGIDAGPLANAIVAESLTPMLMGINKRYKTKSAGIRITDIEIA